jgi:putative ABC transport system substrate-binding protein
MYQLVEQADVVLGKRQLCGVRPADMSVEKPTRFELVVNLKTAGLLGIKVPQAALLHADRVIE